MTKYGCLSNHFNQSKHGTQKETTRKANNTPKHSKTREQTAIDCLKSSQVSSSFQTTSKVKIIMDAETIDNLERADNSAGTRYLIARWRDIVKPGVYRQSGGRWKKYHEPKFLRNERRVIEEQLQQAIRNVENQNQQEPAGGFQPETRRQEQWTVDPFWDVDRPQAPANAEDRPGSSQQQPIPMEEGEIDSESDQDPSILEVPAINWAKYAGVKSVQYIKMGHAPRTTEEPNDWDFGNAVRESEKNFSTDLQLLMTETTNDPTLLKTLVCLERQQQDNIP